MVSEEQSKQIADTEDTQDVTTASPGRLLKAGREKQGLSQQQVADKLFLKAEQIDDLENDRIDEKTSVTFTRGYIRNYAKQLGLSQEEVIAEFDRLHTSAKQPAKLQSFSRRVAKQNHDDRWMMVTYAIVLTLLAGVVVWWYQQSENETLVDDTGSVEQREPQASSPDSNASSAAQDTNFNDEIESLSGQQPDTTEPAMDEIEESNMSVSSSQTPDAAVEDSVSELPPTSNSSRDSNEPAGDTTNESSNPAAETDSSIVSNGDGAAPVNMVFRFADDCWVNIEDSTGEAIAYGIKQAGRVMEISGVPPVEVTLGAPDNVEITVNGEAVDMSVYPGGRTARFSLPIQD